MVLYNDVQEPVTAAVWYALNNYCYTDAVFIAERLHAEVHSSNTAFLLGTCYYRSGRLQQAKHLLKDYISLSSHHGQCALLYAQCCLDLKEYKEGLVAFTRDSLSIKDITDSHLPALFGDNVGVAYLTLGQLKSHLKCTSDAKVCFRAALRHNPFLWSAYEALCDMGEEVYPELCFTLTEYPKFLRPHPSAPPTLFSNPLLQGAYAKSSADSAKSKGPLFTSEDPVKQVFAESAKPDGSGGVFKSVTKSLFTTPEIFQDSSLGNALASSTPTYPRSQFMRDRMAIMESVAKATTRTEASRNVVGALNFGSSERADQKSGVGLVTPLGSQDVTPLHPSFGVLSLTTPTSEESETPLVKGVEKILNFSPTAPVTAGQTTPSNNVTPPPTPLPPDYLKLIQSNPRAGKKVPRMPVTPSPLVTSSSMVDYDLCLGQLSSTGAGHRAGPTPHPLLGRTEHVREQHGRGKRGGSPPTSQLRDMPPSKSAGPLRRSTRLSGTASKRTNEFTMHSTRSKSQMKSPRRNIMEGNSKKGVTFGASVKARASGPAPPPSSTTFSTAVNKSQSATSSSSGAGGVASLGTTPLPLSPVLEGNVLTSNQNAENMQGVGQREGVVSEGRGSSENVKKEVGEGEELERSIQEALAAQQLLEKAAMSGITSLMQLLVSIGQAYHALMNYDLGKAVRLFQALPPHHWETPWVLTQVGQAYFAAERFDKAAKVFKQVHLMDPHRQEGMDLYSSSLWHLQREVELAVMAQELCSSDRLSPQGMCAMASLRNLQKENEAAISLLTKATEAQFRQNKTAKALKTFDKALAINPLNPIPRFHKAKTLEAMSRLEESLSELEFLTRSWPKDPNVCISKGKILKQLNRPSEAVLQFNWALEYSRRAPSSQIREEIDQAYHHQNASLLEDSDADFQPLSDSQNGSFGVMEDDSMDT